MFQVDSVRDDGKQVDLEGWAIKLETDSTDEKLEMLLYDIDDNKILYPKMAYTRREDVNNYFLCEYDYLESGFIASFDSEQVELANKEYEIIVADRIRNRNFHTGVYLSQGICVYANPDEYTELDVEGTELERVVRDGVLRLYRADVGMYVYQYEELFYWIAEKWYGNYEDATSNVECMVNTTQVDRLPLVRRENNWDDDNLGFIFEEEEISDEIESKYRVAVMSIDKQYSITSMQVGDHTNHKGWLWLEWIHPWYIFD